MDLKKLREALSQGAYEWRRHTLERLAERAIAQDDVLQVLMRGEKIESYPTDTPYPSALFFSCVSGRPLHVVVAFDEEDNWAYIITVYEPDLKHFEANFRTRRKNESLI